MNGRTSWAACSAEQNKCSDSVNRLLASADTFVSMLRHGGVTVWTRYVSSFSTDQHCSGAPLAGSPLQGPRAGVTEARSRRVVMTGRIGRPNGATGPPRTGPLSGRPVSRDFQGSGARSVACSVARAVNCTGLREVIPVEVSTGHRGRHVRLVRFQQVGVVNRRHGISVVGGS